MFRFHRPSAALLITRQRPKPVHHFVNACLVTAACAHGKTLPVIRDCRRRTVKVQIESDGKIPGKNLMVRICLQSTQEETGGRTGL